MQLFKRSNESETYDNIIAYLFTFVCVSALLIVRSALFYYESGDYTLFYGPWIETFRTMTFIEGLGTKVGNYNPPYMYILNIIARINFSDVILMKIVSVFFDLLLAVFVMRIVSLKTDSLNIHISALILTMAVPTIILNSSMWGQCDSIYSAFAIGSVYFGMRGKSKLTYVFIALAISFKLQTGFLLPLIAVFILTGKIRFRDCYIFFVVYIAMLLPAIFSGMPINVAFLIYLDQATTYTRLNLNIVNLWQFVGNVNTANFTIAGLFMTGTAVLSLLYFIYIHKERLKENIDYVRLAYIFAVMIPFLLPKMHDRYYFMADALSVAVFIYDKKRWYVPVVTILCSYISYAFLLMLGTELIDFRLAATALFIVIIIVLRDFISSLYYKTEDSGS